MCRCPGCIEEVEKNQEKNRSGETLGSMTRNNGAKPPERKTYITEKGTIITNYYA